MSSWARALLAIRTAVSVHQQAQHLPKKKIQNSVAFERGPE
jgi:hypothetical protein